MYNAIDVFDKRNDGNEHHDGAVVVKCELPIG